MEYFFQLVHHDLLPILDAFYELTENRFMMGSKHMELEKTCNKYSRFKRQIRFFSDIYSRFIQGVGGKDIWGAVTGIASICLQK